MKYLYFDWQYKVRPVSEKHFEEALKKIGKMNPYGISMNRLFKNSKSKVRDIRELDYFNLGVLNVKRRLNGHLGKSGKFTMTMIRKVAKIKHSKHDDNTLIISVPQKDYIKIALATYMLLWENDRGFCKKLLTTAERDSSLLIEENKQIAMKTVAPVHTDIIIKSKGKTDDVIEFIKFVRFVVGREG